MVINNTSKQCILLMIMLLVLLVVCILGCPITPFSYFEKLANEIQPGLKKQITLANDILMLANTPDGNGVFVVSTDRKTITYYDSELRKGDTFVCPAFDSFLNHCSYPASSLVITTSSGEPVTVLTPNRAAQRLFVFNSTKTFLTKNYPLLMEVLMEGSHTFELTQYQKDNFDLNSTEINFYKRSDGSVHYQTTSDTIPDDPDNTPLVFLHGKLLYALRVMGTNVQVDTNTARYTFNLSTYTNFNYNGITFDFLPGEIRDQYQYNIDVPQFIKPEYLYATSNYFAIVFFSDPPTQEKIALCIVFSRINGKVIGSIYIDCEYTHNPPCFAFGNTRIYVAVDNKLSAVEVLP